MFRRPLLVALVMAVVAAPAAQAQQLFKNGAFDGRTGSYSVVSPDAVGRTFDNFLVTGFGWHVTGLTGTFLSKDIWSTAAWEIRTGMSGGVGGTVVASGVANASQSLTGSWLYGYNVYDLGIGGLTVNLNPGAYWMNIAPIVDGYGLTFLATTSGSGASGGLMDSMGLAVNPWSSDYSAMDMDFSIGATGTPAGFPIPLVEGSVGPSVVPEPQSIALVATGLIGLMFVGRKKRRAQ